MRAPRIVLAATLLASVVALSASSANAASGPHPQPRPTQIATGGDAGWPHIVRTGVIRAGVPYDALPFGLRLHDGHFVGFTVDLLREFAKAASVELGRPLTLDLVPSGPDGGVRLLSEGKIDVACGLERPEILVLAGVDPTFPYFLARTIILARPEAAANGFWGLATQPLAVPANLELTSLLLELMPDIPLQRTSSTADALASFRAGRVNAVGGLAEQLLEARSMMDDGESLVVMPGYRDMTREPVACAVPPNQSLWRDVIDHSLYTLLAGFNSSQGRYRQLYDRWIGPSSPVDDPVDELLVSFMDRLRSLPD
jgi:polar amino acid transport system substrate-binding protein